MRAVIYTRTAVRTGGDAIQRQEEACRHFAAMHGWDVTEVFTDDGASGGNMDRPGLQAVMELVRSGGCDVLVADSPEVLTRRVSDLESILADTDAAGVTLRAASFSSSDAVGLAALRMMARP